MNRPGKCAVVSLDVKASDLDRPLTYALEGEPAEKCVPGCRVLVPLGRRSKPAHGYVISVHDGIPESGRRFDLKPVLSVMDEFRVLTEETLALAKWMSEKYYTSLGRCIAAIAPTAKPDGSFPKCRPAAQKPREPSAPPRLTPSQEEAFAEISMVTEKNACPVILLHGATGSGKTELYFRAIEKTMGEGKDAILLVPEIALAPQMVKLFYARFGDLVAVTHSRLTAGERFAIWKKALDGEIRLVIGPRSAVFSPFASLGLIVVDEEHVDSYHSERDPKYDARAVAIERARLSGAAVLLGSATPSLESYTKAKGAEIALVKLGGRIGKSLPEILVVDMRKEIARGNATMFSAPLAGALAGALAGGKQAILFLNRRGHSSFVSCRRCGHVLGCVACRVNYTYHASGHQLLCHYCGRGEAVPRLCPACQSEHIRRSGIGTQKVEEEARRLFPGTEVLRMDTDTTKGKRGHEKVLDAFQKGGASILVGTQMVAKGLDFPQVTVVGVMAADMSLYTSDFRSAERTYQLLAQVSGRAGRAADPGFVFVQTYSPEHYAIKLARNNSYETFYEHEAKLRFSMDYPPYTNVFSVMVTGPVEADVIGALKKLMAVMEYAIEKDSRRRGGRRRFEIVGMSPAFVSKINMVFRWKILLKCRDEKALTSFVLYSVEKLRAHDPLKGLALNLHLNPVMME